MSALRATLPSGAPEVNASPLLVSCWFCPYVQRVWLALGVKKIGLDEAEVDLFNKPEWFLQTSPLGKVPVITFQEHGKTRVLYESLVLVDWVEDFFGRQGPSLLPYGATERALARILISRFDGSFIPAYYKLLAAGSKEEAHTQAEGLRKELTWLEANMSSDGPFAMGADISSVDCAIAPWLLRGHILKHYRNYDMLEGFPRVAAYVEALKAHPAVQSSIKPPAGEDWFGAMVPKYSKYAKEVAHYF